MISLLRVIRPSDCDLNYHFGPQVLEYGRKKLYILRFPQLVFVMTSPLRVLKKKKKNEPFKIQYRPVKSNLGAIGPRWPQTALDGPQRTRYGPQRTRYGPRRPRDGPRWTRMALDGKKGLCALRRAFGLYPSPSCTRLGDGLF